MLHKKIAIIFIFLCTQAVAQKKLDYPEWQRSFDSGYYYLNRFMSAESMKHFNDAIKASENLPKVCYAASLFGEGQATWYAGNYRHAADTVELAIRFFPPENREEIILALRVLSNIYDELGDFEKAFIAVQKAISLNKSSGSYNRVLPWIQLGKLYKNIGDLESAMHYYQLAMAEHPTPTEYPFRELYHNLGGLYAAKGQFDSAAFFYRSSLNGNPLSNLIRLRLGELQLLQKNYDSAYYYLDALYQEGLPPNDVNIVAGTCIALAKVMLERGELSPALQFATEAYTISSQKNVYRFYKEAATLLAVINEKKGEAKAALYFHKIADSLDHAASSDVYKGQLFAFRQKSEEATHASDLQALRDEKKIAQRTIVIVLLASVLAIALLLFRYYHVRLRLKQRAAELEMQALRAQMNPHFIFNCLSAINHFILDSQNDKASDYLTRFSRLVRMVLVNAGKEAIALDEELDMLRLYLDMEQLRFKNAFTYSIQIPEGINTAQLQVPCFILQPFCENAIWHGLLHKEEQGHLEIVFQESGNRLRVTIRDNGIGRTRAAALSKKEHSSMGQQLTASRLALFNRQRAGQSVMKLKDLTAANGEVIGTEVTLFIQTHRHP